MLLKQAAGIPIEKKKGGEVIDGRRRRPRRTGKYKGYKVTSQQVKDIAKRKFVDLNARDEEHAGTHRCRNRAKHGAHGGGLILQGLRSASKTTPPEDKKVRDRGPVCSCLFCFTPVGFRFHILVPRELRTGNSIMAKKQTTAEADATKPDETASAAEPKAEKKPRKPKTSPAAPAGEGAPESPPAASPDAPRTPAAPGSPAAGGGTPEKKKRKPGIPPARGKKLRNHVKNVIQRLGKDGPATLKKAVSVLKQIKRSKFDETVEVHMSLGVDTTQSDQLLRGTVPLPHGIGKSVRVAVFMPGRQRGQGEGSRRRCGRRRRPDREECRSRTCSSSTSPWRRRT